MSTFLSAICNKQTIYLAKSMHFLHLDIICMPHNSCFGLSPPRQILWLGWSPRYGRRKAGQPCCVCTVTKWLKVHSLHTETKTAYNKHPKIFLGKPTLW